MWIFGHIIIIFMLIKMSVLNLLYYWHFLFGGFLIKFYLLKNTFLSTYILTLAKPLPLTEMAELPNWEKLECITVGQKSCKYQRRNKNITIKINVLFFYSCLKQLFPFFNRRSSKYTQKVHPGCSTCRTSSWSIILQPQSPRFNYKVHPECSTCWTSWLSFEFFDQSSRYTESSIQSATPA